MIRRPFVTFRRTRYGSASSAAKYASLTGVLVGALHASVGIGVVVYALYQLARAPLMDEAVELARLMGTGIALALMPLVFPVAALLNAAIRATVFRAAVAVVGGRGGWKPAFWAACYLQALLVVLLTPMALPDTPRAMILLPLSIGIEVIHALGMTIIARRHYGLEGGRAVAAGWAIFALTALASGCCLVPSMLFAPAPG